MHRHYYGRYLDNNATAMDTVARKLKKEESDRAGGSQKIMKLSTFSATKSEVSELTGTTTAKQQECQRQNYDGDHDDDDDDDCN